MKTVIRIDTGAYHDEFYQQFDEKDGSGGQNLCYEIEGTLPCVEYGMQISLPEGVTVVLKEEEDFPVINVDVDQDILFLDVIIEPGYVSQRDLSVSSMLVDGMKKAGWKFD